MALVIGVGIEHVLIFIVGLPIEGREFGVEILEKLVLGEVVEHRLFVEREIEHIDRIGIAVGAALECYHDGTRRLNAIGQQCKGLVGEILHIGVELVGELREEPRLGTSCKDLLDAIAIVMIAIGSLYAERFAETVKLDFFRLYLHLHRYFFDKLLTGLGGGCFAHSGRVIDG